MRFSVKGILIQLVVTAVALAIVNRAAAKVPAVYQLVYGA